MPIPFIDRPPTNGEFEKLRLLLSAFQDGTGQYKTKPGWRDFERIIALLLDGEAVENKAIFDVQVADSARPPIKYGIACKMRGDLNYLDRHGRLTIEVSNANEKFWSELRDHGIKEQNLDENVAKAGYLVVKLIEKWQDAVSIQQGGDIDLDKSCYLVLTYKQTPGIYNTGFYVVHKLSLNLPDPATLTWVAPSVKRIAGIDGEQTVYEWYHKSGSQLKYYPRGEDALWVSPRFKLEPLPPDVKENSIQARAQAYYPELWDAASAEE